MNRALFIALGPEVLLALITGFVVLYCGRHNSYSDADVRAVQRLIWLLPLVAVPVAYLTVALPGARTWTWLIRVNLAVMVAVVICAALIIEGFGAPGSGPKGQEAGFILIIVLSGCLCSFGNAITGAIILSAHKPAFADWFRLHSVAGPVLTGLAAFPLAVAQTAVGGIVVAVVVAVLTLFKH